MNYEAIIGSNAIPVQNGNSLFIAVWNPGVSGKTLLLRYQILEDDGNIANGLETFAVLADTADTQFLFKITKGLLLTASLTATSADLQSGEMYATLAIQLGDVSNANQRINLISGYVSAFGVLTYPLGEPKASNDTPGANLTRNFSDPGAGVEMNLTFSGFERAKLTGLSFQFTTDGFLGSRRVALLFSDLGGNILRAVANATQLPSTTVTYFIFFGSVPATLPPDTLYIPVMPLPPLRSMAIVSSTASFAVGDVFEAINAFYNTQTAL